MSISVITSSSHKLAKPVQKIIIDSGDLPLVKDKRWTIDKDGYVINYTHKKINGKKQTTQTRIHRLIMGAKPGEIIDHINGNRLDNSKKNLRVVSSSINALNRHKKQGKTNYFGVFFNKQFKKYQTKIMVEGKTKHLGFFDNPKEAEKVYLNYKNHLIKERI